MGLKVIDLTVRFEGPEECIVDNHDVEELGLVLARIAKRFVCDDVETKVLIIYKDEEDLSKRV